MERQSVIVLDTHALIWTVAGDTRLGEQSRAMIEKTARTGRVLVSAITPWEIALLSEERPLAAWAGSGIVDSRGTCVAGCKCGANRTRDSR